MYSLPFTSKYDILVSKSGDECPTSFNCINSDIRFVVKTGLLFVFNKDK